MVCFDPVYSYEFSYNGDSYIADNCDTSYYGNSYCLKDGVRYENVEYKETRTGCLHEINYEEPGINGYIFLGVLHFSFIIFIIFIVYEYYKKLKK